MKKTSALGKVAACVAALALTGTAVASAEPVPPAPAVPAPPAITPGSVAPWLYGTPPAGAQQIVTFGDSFTAIGKIGAPMDEFTERGYQLKPTCKKDTRNWPHAAAQEADKTLADWSCNGTGGMGPLVELPTVVAEAIAAGNIGPGTEKVVISYGGLDVFQWVDVATAAANVSALTPSMMQGVYAGIKQQVAVAAPGAEVVIAGYPEFASGDQLCLFNDIPDQPTPIAAPGATLVQDNLRNAQKHAAQAAGLRFIDVLEATRGRGTCAQQPEDRWTVGINDPAVATNLTMHPSLHGATEVGKIIGTELYK